MSHAWESHGLIGRPELEYAYREAQVGRDEAGGFVDPGKHKTTRLFERLFNRIIFTESRFFVNSRQPPTDGSALACDIVVSAVNGAYEEEMFCFCEGTRLKDTGARGFNIRDVENHAHNYCNVHLDARPHKPYVYACTLVGTYIRCWVVNQHERVLEGLWSPEDEGPVSSYLDVGIDENKPTLERAFARLKSLPITTGGRSHEEIDSFP